jgi:CheY-like chemotaxis protein
MSDLVNCEEAGKAKILLVEDNTINQKLALKLLQKAGHEVQTANNGRLACAAVEAATFDLILMDVQMPEMDGYAATACIRARAGERRIPIIAMTAHAMTGDRERCLAAGMDDYITKPLDFDELHTLLARWLQPTEPATAPDLAPKADPVDMAALRLITDGDEEFLRELVELYLADAPERMENLRRAVASRVAITIKQEAHGLKGASANLSAKGLQTLMAEIEQLAAAEQLAEVTDVMQAAESEFGQVQRFLQKVAGRV